MKGIETPAPDAESEARQWCSTRVDQRLPRFCLRTPKLQPPELDRMTYWGMLPNDIDWVGMTERLVRARRSLLVPGTPAQSGGRVLAYLPGDNLADGSAKAASKGFLDQNNMPPWDTWIRFSDEALYAWIPPQFEQAVQDAIDANPEECIFWADAGPSIRRAPTS